MDLIALAVPFFVLALLLELLVDRIRHSGHFRTSDALNSLSAGVLSTTTGYFTRLVAAAIWAYVLQDLSLFDVDPAWFNATPTGIALWIVALVGFDFCYYWAHRCGHEVSILWAAHAVHHQSEDYNLSTALRQTSTGFIFGWIFYLPLFLLGIPFEVFVTVNAIDLIYQFWVHTQKIRRLGWMDRVFVTPSNHRVHHAQNEIYIDKNYGGIFILWDRMFGTYQEELDSDPVLFGVRKSLQSWNPFWANLQVYNYLWFDAVRTKNWRDKLGIWFRRTGWRPADVEKQYPRKTHNPDQFRKFDPPLDVGTNRYLLFQYLVVIASVLWIGVLFAKEGALAVLIPCILLWSMLYAIGLISELRHFARKFEMLRLFLIVPAGLLLTGIEPGSLQGVVAMLYILFSALLLQSIDGMAPATDQSAS